MIEEIANNKYYIIKIDKSKNRLYTEAHGFWPNVAAVANYIPDIVKAKSMLNDGFTYLSDGRNFKTSPPEVMQMFGEERKTKMGSKTASILGQDAILQMAAKKGTSDQKSESFRFFSDLPTAEAWLDQK